MAENDLPSLPPPLADSYRHYKDLTRSFATWLAGTGERCGFRLSTAKQTTTRPPENSSDKANPRLKGKARKLARDADKKAQNKSPLTKTLLLKDFIPLAKHIASSKPPPNVPSSVLMKLERAIDLRRRCASWFNTKVQSTASLASNASHEHFINILNTVLDILKPLCNQSTGSGHGKNNTTSGNEGEEGVEPQLTLYNQFEALTLETLEDDQEELENFSQQRTNPAKPGKTASPATTIYTPEQQLPDDEFILGCFCFFQDLQDVRGFLKETWQKYKDKQVTLITASLITTAALDFVRKSELNFKTTFSQSGDYYDIFVDQMFRRACTRQGHPFVARRNFRATTTNLHETQPYVDDMVSEAEWIMLPSWHLLNYSARIFLLEEDGVPSRFQAVLEAEDHMVKVWQLFAPNPAPESVHADRREHQSFDALLLGIGMGTFKNQFDNVGVDQFRTGLAEMLQTDMIPAWLVFATQNFLDIQHILKQDVSRGWQDFKSTFAMLHDRVQQHINHLKPLGAENTVESRDCEMFEACRERYFEIEVQDLQTVFLLHPVGAGLREFFTVTCFRRIGTYTGNSSDVISMAHLYHVSQLQSQCATWPDMEFVIGTQTPEHVFLGGRPPTFEQCWRKVELSLGYSMRNFLSSAAPDSSIRRRKTIRMLDPDDLPITSIFFARGMVPRVSDIERTTENLETVLTAALHGVDRAKFKQDDYGKLANRAELLKRTSRKPKATMRQLLVVLEENLVHEQTALHFDYYGFRIVCYKLLKAIAQRIRSAWIHATWLEPDDGCELPTQLLTYLIFNIANMSFVLSVGAGVPHLASRVLNEVTVMLEDHIRPNGSTLVRNLQQFASGALLWADYKARFGEPASNQDQESSAARPTITSMTEEEMQRTRRIGDSANGLPSLEPSYFQVTQRRR